MGTRNLLDRRKRVALALAFALCLALTACSASTGTRQAGSASGVVAASPGTSAGASSSWATPGQTPAGNQSEPRGAAAATDSAAGAAQGSHPPGQAPTLTKTAERTASPDGTWLEKFGYPIVSGISPQIGARINADIKALIDAHRKLEGLRSFDGATDVCRSMRPEATSAIEYRVDYVSARLLSLVFDYTYIACDVGDGGPFDTYTLNYRLDTGQRLTTSDLFSDPSGAWGTIHLKAPYILGTARPECLDSWDSEREGQWWAAWAIRSEGIEIDLDESTVSSLGCGFVTFVVGWEVFRAQQASSGVVAQDLHLPKPYATPDPSGGGGPVAG
jgi:hypothetical protein